MLESYSCDVVQDIISCNWNVFCVFGQNHLGGWNWWEICEINIPVEFSNTISQYPITRHKCANIYQAIIPVMLFLIVVYVQSNWKELSVYNGYRKVASSVFFVLEDNEVYSYLFACDCVHVGDWAVSMHSRLWCRKGRVKVPLGGCKFQIARHTFSESAEKEGCLIFLKENATTL